MGIQMIVKASHDTIEKALGNIYSDSEVFPISAGVFGVSITTNIIDKVGDEEVFRRFEQMEHFWLWLGKWQKKQQS